MNEIAYRFITPLDVLFLRGNQSFGDPGSYGASVMPPWPSVAAGAIRSRMLADDGIDLAAFANGKVPHPALGTPAQPGSFVLRAFHLARKSKSDSGHIEMLIAPPADLFVTAEGDGKPRVQCLVPTVASTHIATSSPLPLLPVLAQSVRNKAACDWWLTQTGWQKYLHGKTPDSTDMVKSSALWSMDERIGVGLSEATRSAEDGKLFANRAVALKPDIGFVVAVAGAVVPAVGLLRLGGDGRGAIIESVKPQWPEPDYDAIARARRCRLVLTSPGLFVQGWLPTGCTQTANGSIHFNLHDVQARLVAASVTRSEVISGWDLAAWKPKPAQRVAPSGSVYWLEDIQASADALRKLVTHGLWSEPCEDPARRAEGFNRICLAQS